MEAETKIPVLLLKTRSLPTDAYESHFTVVDGGRFEPVFVPVLEHRFDEGAIAWLKDHVQRGAFNQRREGNNCPTGYGGIIFTSQRAVDAFSQVIAALRADGEQTDDLLPAAIPLYVVGPATARGLRALDLRCQILGENTGNGEALAAFIQEHYNSLHTTEDGEIEKLPLLFLVGEQRRDIIPRTLQTDAADAPRIEVHEKVVYDTIEKQNFRAELEALWQKYYAQDRIQWVVVFSPTGCKALLETLRLFHDESAKVTNDNPRASRTSFIATIGPTTREYMVKEFGFEADVSASKPTPEALCSAIIDRINALNTI